MEEMTDWGEADRAVAGISAIRFFVFFAEASIGRQGLRLGCRGIFFAPLGGEKRRGGKVFTGVRWGSGGGKIFSRRGHIASMGRVSCLWSEIAEMAFLCG